MIMTTTIYTTATSIIMCNSNNCTNRNSSKSSSSSSSAAAAAFGLRRSSGGGGGDGGGLRLQQHHRSSSGIHHHRGGVSRWLGWGTTTIAISSSSSSSSSGGGGGDEDDEDDDVNPKQQLTTTATGTGGGGNGAGGIQVYRDIERLLMDTVKQSQGAFGASSDWTEVEGAWVLKPKNSKPVSVVHFVGGIFVGAAPQLTYRLFLERLAQKGILVIATPYSSGFDHFLIADEVQFKFDRCRRVLQEPIQDLPTFGIGHSLGALIHLLIGSRYAVERKGNVLMAFNNKDASLAIPIFSPVLVPMAQNMGPFLSQIISSPTLRMGAEMTKKQLENLSPAIMKQVLPLVEQLPPLYLDLANGRENFNPKPEETRRIIKSYYGVSTNLLIKFKDDTIDETSALAYVLSDSAISSKLDMSIRYLPGDHGLPLQQALPDVPPAMADAVNRGGELLANLSIGTPWESVAKEMSNTLGGVDKKILRAEISKDLDMLVDVITSWMASNEGPKLLKS